MDSGLLIGISGLFGALFFFAMGGGLTLLMARFQNHEKYLHRCGIGAAVCFSIGAAALLSFSLAFLLGLDAVGFLRSSLIGCGVVAVAFGVFLPSIDKTLGFRVPGQVHPGPRATPRPRKHHVLARLAGPTMHPTPTPAPPTVAPPASLKATAAPTPSPTLRPRRTIKASPKPRATPCISHDSHLTGYLVNSSPTDTYGGTFILKNDGTTIARHVRFGVYARFADAMNNLSPIQPKPPLQAELDIGPGLMASGSLTQTVGVSSPLPRPLAQLYLYYIYVNSDMRLVEGEQAWEYRKELPTPLWVGMDANFVVQHDEIREMLRGQADYNRMIKVYCGKRH